MQPLWALTFKYIVSTCVNICESTMVITVVDTGLMLKGGIMGIFIDWNCDLDFPERFCIPKYSFSRLDNKNPENNVAPGYNFR